MEKTMITSLAWVAKGFAKAMPREYDINQEEVEEMKNDPMIQEESLKTTPKPLKNKFFNKVAKNRENRCFGDGDLR